MLQALGGQRIDDDDRPSCAPSSAGQAIGIPARCDDGDRPADGCGEIVDGSSGVREGCPGPTRAPRAECPSPHGIRNVGVRNGGGSCPRVVEDLAGVAVVRVHMEMPARLSAEGVVARAWSASTRSFQEACAASPTTVHDAYSPRRPIIRHCMGIGLEPRRPGCAHTLRAARYGCATTHLADRWRVQWLPVRCWPGPPRRGTPIGHVVEIIDLVEAAFLVAVVGDGPRAAPRARRSRRYRPPSTTPRRGASRIDSAMPAKLTVREDASSVPVCHYRPRATATPRARSTWGPRLHEVVDRRLPEGLGSRLAPLPMGRPSPRPQSIPQAAWPTLRR